jgi:hypothetical protein
VSFEELVELGLGLALRKDVSPEAANRTGVKLVAAAGSGCGGGLVCATLSFRS